MTKEAAQGWLTRVHLKGSLVGFHYSPWEAALAWGLLLNEAAFFFTQQDRSGDCPQETTQRCGKYWERHTRNAPSGFQDKTLHSGNRGKLRGRDGLLDGLWRWAGFQTLERKMEKKMHDEQSPRGRRHGLLVGSVFWTVLHRHSPWEESIDVL